jgi:hypothetical protein
LESRSFIMASKLLPVLKKTTNNAKLALWRLTTSRIDGSAAIVLT